MALFLVPLGDQRTTVQTGGDPRGWTLRLVLASKHKSGWGDGYGIYGS
jgi:hypothetical protein